MANKMSCTKCDDSFWFFPICERWLWHMWTSKLDIDNWYSTIRGVWSERSMGSSSKWSYYGSWCFLQIDDCNIYIKIRILPILMRSPSLSGVIFGFRVSKGELKNARKIRLRFEFYCDFTFSSLFLNFLNPTKQLKLHNFPQATRIPNYSKQ